MTARHSSRAWGTHAPLTQTPRLPRSCISSACWWCSGVLRWDASCPSSSATTARWWPRWPCSWSSAGEWVGGRACAGKGALPRREQRDSHARQDLPLPLPCPTRPPCSGSGSIPRGPCAMHPPAPTSTPASSSQVHQRSQSGVQEPVAYPQGHHRPELQPVSADCTWHIFARRRAGSRPEQNCGLVVTDPSFRACPMTRALHARVLLAPTHSPT